MKERKDIIESGIIEQYLLGELSEKKHKEVASLIENDSELKQYLAALEKDFEKMALENAIDPPTDVKEKIFNTIESAPKVIPLNAETNYKVYLSVVACIALIFMVGGVWMYQKMNGLEQQLQIVSEENKNLQEKNIAIEDNYTTILDWYTSINKPEARKIVFTGNDLAPNAKAVSYINHKEKSVVLDAKGLPNLPKDKDYQLWADVEGEMISMGVIPKDSEMLTMKYIDNAASLNITIEPAGGNDHATVENLIANVYLNTTP